MAQFKFVSPGFRLHNTLGGVRIKLSDDEVKKLSGGTSAASAATSIASGSLAHFGKLAKPGHGAIANGVVSVALLGITHLISKTNDRHGNQGVVIEMGYPNLLPEVYGPGQWDVDD